MFDFSFQEEGLVDQTVIHLEHLNKCNDVDLPFWVYYTGGEMDITNRKITNTAASTRVLGILMYRYKALGFLHWAYNFYYDRMSEVRAKDNYEQWVKFFLLAIKESAEDAVYAVSATLILR